MASRACATSARRTSTTWRCARRSTRARSGDRAWRTPATRSASPAATATRTAYKPGLFDGSYQDRHRRRPRSGARRRALHGQVGRRRHQDVRDGRRALRGRCGWRIAVHLRGAQGDGRRGDEARSQGRRARARHRGHQDRGARRRELDRARLVPRRGRREDDGGQGHVSRADAERGRGRRERGEQRRAQGPAAPEGARRGQGDAQRGQDREGRRREDRARHRLPASASTARTRTSSR